MKSFVELNDNELRAVEGGIIKTAAIVLGGIAAAGAIGALIGAVINNTSSTCSTCGGRR